MADYEKESVASKSAYVDYETFLDEKFDSINFANSLVLATNNASDDISVDLTTPLSKVLFDLQDIDTRIDSLATTSALPLLKYTEQQDTAATEIVSEVEQRVGKLTDGYRRLERDVIDKYRAAEQVRLAAERAWQALRIGRIVARCLTLGRQLEAQMAETGLTIGKTSVHESFGAKAGTGISSAPLPKKEDHWALLRAGSTVHQIETEIEDGSQSIQASQIISASSARRDPASILASVHLIRHLQISLLNPAMTALSSRSQQIVREFSVLSSGLSSTSSDTSTMTHSQFEEIKARTTSALLTLYHLSPQSTQQALQAYIRTALNSSLAALARSLSNLTNLDRTLSEISARCQNIVALEAMLDTIYPDDASTLERDSVVESSHKPSPPTVHNGLSKPPKESSSPNNLRSTQDKSPSMLKALLHALDTSSLPSYFWRSLAEGLSSRVMELLAKGGPPARNLRGQKERLRSSIKACVLQGSQVPASIEPDLNQGPASSDSKTKTSWDREAAVMVGSVLGPLAK